MSTPLYMLWKVTIYLTRSFEWGSQLSPMPLSSIIIKMLRNMSTFIIFLTFSVRRIQNNEQLLTIMNHYTPTLLWLRNNGTRFFLTMQRFSEELMTEHIDSGLLKMRGSGRHREWHRCPGDKYTDQGGWSLKICWSIVQLNSPSGITRS